MERWLIAEVRMYFKTSVEGVSCSTKPSSLLHISVLQVPTGTIRYQKFIDWEQKNIHCQLIWLFKINRHNIVWGGGEWGRDSCFFFPLKYWVGSVPYGIVSQVIFKTKYRYINRAISSSIIKLWLEPAYQWFLVKRSLYTHHSHYISSLLI